MKNAVIAACIILLATQSLLIDAGSRRTRPSSRKQKGQMATPEHLVQINNVVEHKLSEKCRATIKRYGKAKVTVQENCVRLARYRGFLSKRGCGQDDHDNLYNVLRCGTDQNKVAYQEQKDVTTMAPGKTNMTQAIYGATTGKSNVTQAITTVTPTITSGSQAGGNATY